MNNTPKSFYVLYPQDKIINNILNAIKVLSDDSQRTGAHITVRGPYSKKLAQSTVDICSHNITDTSLHFSKVGNFFDYGQNTVFFKCDDNENLRKIWKKKEYEDFKPHVTLYDGTDKKFAKRLFDKLQQNFQPFEFKVDELSYLESKSSDELNFYLHRLKQDFVDFEDLKGILNTDIDKEKINKIKEHNKLNYIGKLNAKLCQSI